MAGDTLTFDSPLSAFADILLNGNLPPEQLGALAGTFRAAGLNDLTGILATLQDPTGIEDPQQFAATVYAVLEKDEARIRELLVQAQAGTPGTMRFQNTTAATMRVAAVLAKPSKPNGVADYDQVAAAERARREAVVAEANLQSPDFAAVFDRNNRGPGLILFPVLRAFARRQGEASRN